MKGKKEPRTVGKLCRTGGAMTIKYMFIIASSCVKIKGVKL